MSYIPLKSTYPVSKPKEGERAKARENVYPALYLSIPFPSIHEFPSPFPSTFLTCDPVLPTITTALKAPVPFPAPFPVLQSTTDGV